MRTARLPCGCTHERDRERWMDMCPTHREEWRVLHEAAQRRVTANCEDCGPYEEPHGPHCRSHPDYDGAPR